MTDATTTAAMDTTSTVVATSAVGEAAIASQGLKDVRAAILESVNPINYFIRIRSNDGKQGSPSRTLSLAQSRFYIGLREPQQAPEGYEWNIQVIKAAIPYTFWQVNDNNRNIDYIITIWNDTLTPGNQNSIAFTGTARIKPGCYTSPSAFAAAVQEALTGLYTLPIITGNTISATSTTVVLPPAASATNEAYKNMYITFFSGPAFLTNSPRRIAKYDGATRTVTVYTPFEALYLPTPSGGDTYVITMSYDIGCDVDTSGRLALFQRSPSGSTASPYNSYAPEYGRLHLMFRDPVTTAPYLIPDNLTVISSAQVPNGTRNAGSMMGFRGNAYGVDVYANVGTGTQVPDLDFMNAFAVFGSNFYYFANFGTNFLRSPNVIDLLPIDRITVRYRNVGFSDTYSTRTDGESNLIASLTVPSSHAFHDMIELTAPDPEIHVLRTASVAFMEFELTDNDGNLLDLQGHSWYMAIELVLRAMPYHVENQTVETELESMRTAVIKSLYGQRTEEDPNVEANRIALERSRIAIQSVLQRLNIAS